MDNSNLNKSEAKILLVEDDLSIRELYARTLRKGGFEVLEVEDGERGLQEIQESKYDLILLDIMLPKISGIDILKKLHEAGGNSAHRRIVMLTNLDTDSMVYTCLSLGASGYLIKDQVQPYDLAKEVRSHLGEHI
jgi:DNA-binding response OmpR family regulator